jgi:prolyl-tRNA editing enzyme YbaK/EbsC (Cys-tRNA(Pro) deacylase)
MNPVQQVQAALDALNAGVRMVEFAASTATAPEAAAAAGCALGAIVKSLLFLIDGQPVLVLAAGDRNVDQKLLGAVYGVGKRKVKLADAQTVLDTTGFAVGGVPPVGHTRPLPVLIDDSLGRFETVWAAAGAHNAVFPIAYTKLVEITSGRVETLTEKKSLLGEELWADE